MYVVFIITVFSLCCHTNLIVVIVVFVMTHNLGKEDKIKPILEGHKVSVTDEKAVRAAIDAIVKKYGFIDVLGMSFFWISPFFFYFFGYGFFVYFLLKKLTVRQRMVVIVEK